jgi:SAM-dependent methyltransferase
MKIQDKMKQDWDRRAQIDPYYWVAATQEADLESYEHSAQVDCEAFLKGFLKIKDQEWSESVAQSFFQDQVLLDLGCGIGRMTAPLAAYFKQAIGVDVSDQMIIKAKELHASVGNLTFFSNSGTDLGMVEPASVDIVCSYSVLAHLPVDVTESYFLEIGKILKPQGYFRYQFWVNQTANHPSDQDSLSIHVYDEAQFQRLHTQAGLQVIATEEIDYFDPVLQIKPLWVTAQKVGEPQALANVDREIQGDAISNQELLLEYDLILYLAMKYQDRGENAEAERVLSEAIQLEPNRPEAYLHWTSLRLALDDLTGTTTILEELTAKCPTCTEGWLYLAQVFQASDQPFKALDALEKCEKLFKKEQKALLQSKNELSQELLTQQQERLVSIDTHRLSLLKMAQKDALKKRKR